PRPASPSPSTTAGPTASTSGSASGCARSSPPMPGCGRPRASSCPPDPGLPGNPMNLTSVLLLTSIATSAGASGAGTPPAAASPAPAPAASPSPASRHTLLVLPLEAAGTSSETWIGELVADQLPRALAYLGVPA